MCYILIIDTISTLETVSHYFPFIILVRSKDYSRAVDSFERTLDLAKVMGDETAESAIKSALNDVNKKIAQV